MIKKKITSHSISQVIEKYYSNKLSRFGPDYRSVDWPSRESQTLRFAQLLKLLPQKSKLSLLDFGCGYAALFDYLKKHDYRINYTGYDCSPSMVDSAKQRHRPGKNFTILHHLKRNKQYDYLVSSGIFNVKLEFSRKSWISYVLDHLHQFDKLSRRGFAFNVLSSYSDKECQKSYLYYANPCFLFDYCKKHFSHNISLLHDYGMYEFTLLIKKHKESV